jgi:hypothetical protein
MRSFKQQADRIVELIDNRLHPTTVEELLPLLKDAAEQYHRENPELSKRCFHVDIQDDYVDFAFWNPDTKCTESSGFVRNLKHKDKAGDESLLDWVRRSIRRLAEDAKTVLWYEFENEAFLPARQTLSDNAKDEGKYGIKRLQRGVYAVREDRIRHYIKPSFRDLKRFHQG